MATWASADTLVDVISSVTSYFDTSRVSKVT